MLSSSHLNVAKVFTYVEEMLIEGLESKKLKGLAK